MRICISVSEEVLARIDRLREKYPLSRSKVIECVVMASDMEVLPASSCKESIKDRFDPVEFDREVYGGK